MIASNEEHDAVQQYRPKSAPELRLWLIEGSDAATLRA
jgi:hypothetical protein